MNGIATDAMMEFAMAIAEELDIEEPNYDNFLETREFISEHEKEFYQSIKIVEKTK